MAGVLRGDRSRFQLFGDTMNTASRMETTGVVNRIQISQETANLLNAANKREWVVPRATRVMVKGKGNMTTFFLRSESCTGRGPIGGQNDVQEAVCDEEET